MIDVRSFDGSAEELSEFVVGVWRESYAGKMSFPMWSPDYLRWQLRWDDPAQRHNQLAAYDGARLVGALLGTSYPMQSLSQRHAGSIGSWLSIDREYRGRAIVTALAQERLRQQAGHDSRLVVSYRFVGSRHSLAERPKPGGRDPSKVFLRKVGFWARVLDARRAARWNVNSLEGFLSRLGGPFTPHPHVRNQDGAIRPCTAGDLNRCVQILQAQTRQMPLFIDWDAASLGHQLVGSPVSQTLVMDIAGQVSGFVNFHVLPFLGRTVEPVGVIDIAALDELPAASRTCLMNAALEAMRQAGAVIALKLRTGDCPSGTLLRTHFVPRMADSYVVLQWIGTPLAVPQSARMHLLWR